jgi:hypothetical protein
MGVLRYILIIAIVLISVPSFATDRWVSPTGAATWANCTGEAKDGVDACSIYTANQNADDDDVVYLRAGTYYIGTSSATGNGHDTDALSPGIIPVNSGSLGHIIEFKPYSTETVNFVGRGDVGIGSYGIWINAKSYIKITGTSLGQWNFTKMGENLVVGPATGALPTGDSSYNEISYITMYDSFENESWGGWDWQGSVIWKRAYYNHVHHCKFYQHGWLGTGNSENEGDVFNIGSETGTSTDYEASYNVFENNEVYSGGHAALEVYGKYNVVRNNYMHNEPWYDIDGTLYGYRVLLAAGKDPNAGYHIIENNRLGHGGENAATNNSGGTGFKLGSPYNIVRYNSVFNNVMTGIYLHSSDPSYTTPQYNYIYNNTLYKNGFSTEVEANNWQKSPIVFGYNGSSLTWSNITYNVIKNNLFYGGWNTVTGNQPGIYLDTSKTTLTAATDTGHNTITPNWDDYVIEEDPFADTDAKDVSDPTSSTKPTLLLASTSSAINYSVYLTTAVKKDDNTMTFTDARYFQDAKFGLGESGPTWPSNISVAADYVCFSMTTSFTGCTNKQIEAINYSTGDVTITGHGLTAETTYYVALYKDSDGTQTLYGSKPDAGAHEYETSGGSSYTVTVSSSGTGCTYTHSGAYSIDDGDTLNVAVTINNGWQNAWSGTCSATGTTTRVCTPAAEQCSGGCTVVGVCTEIKLFP